MSIIDIFTLRMRMTFISHGPGSANVRGNNKESICAGLGGRPIADIYRSCAAGRFAPY